MQVRSRLYTLQREARNRRQPHGHVEDLKDFKNERKQEQGSKQN
jgi:hypothetical protein